MYKKLIILVILVNFIIIIPSAIAKNIIDSIQPAENLYGSIVKPSNKNIVLNLISNFGNVEVPTSTIITHANNDFSIFRFEMNNKGKWHIANKDTVIVYEDLGNKLILSLQKNLAIKKSPERTKMIIIINVPAKWTGMNSAIKLTLKPWTLDRVGRMNEYNPGSLLEIGNNFRELYKSIRTGEFINPGQNVSLEVQKELKMISNGDIYISKGLSPLLTSRSYIANKYLKIPNN